jgi:Mn-dependent DtxR family transcriptional regulator
MSLGRKKLQILQMLSLNLRNPQPEAVRSDAIAHRLQISMPETVLLIKVMNDMGVIQSNMEHRLCLITRKGMECLKQAEVQ